MCITHYLISNQIFDVDAIDSNGCTALHWACLEGSYDVIKYLLAAKANLNAQTLKELSTPMHVAIQSVEYYNDARIIFKLVSYKCRIDLRDADSKLPFDYLVEIEDADMQQEVMQILAASKVNSNQTKKKVLLGLLLGLQMVFSLVYLYPLQIIINGFNFADCLVVTIGSLICFLYMISYFILLNSDPGTIN